MAAYNSPAQYAPQPYSSIGQPYMPQYQRYEQEMARLEQMKQQFNEQYAQPQQPNVLRFDCVAVANKEELLARPCPNKDIPIIGTNFINDVIYVKDYSGNIEVYRLVDEPEPEIVVPEGFVSTDAHNAVVERVNELTSIIIGLKDELDAKSGTLDAKIEEKSVALDEKIAEKTAEIETITAQLNDRDDVENELDKRINALRSELNGEIDNAKKQIRELGKSSSANEPTNRTTVETDSKSTSIGATNDATSTFGSNQEQSDVRASTPNGKGTTAKTTARTKGASDGTGKAKRT